MMTMPAIETMLRQPAAQAMGWALLQFVWQGTAVGALTAVALLALRRSAADIRYVVAAIGLALMLTLPVVSGVQKFQALRADPDAPVQAPDASIASPDGRSRAAPGSGATRSKSASAAASWSAAITSTAPSGRTSRKVAPGSATTCRSSCATPASARRLASRAS
jgi:hypothetical protein